MSKSSHLIILAALAVLALSSRSHAAEENRPVVAAAGMKAMFAQPPPSSRPWCYWYWMAGNITRDGILADLNGFDKVGIGGLFIMDIGEKIPAGNIIYRSPEWWDLFSFACAEASKRNIKVSFHCPGWSASGGPWITPEMGMQEVVWSETTLEGGKPYKQALPAPASRLDYYREIAVVAFPQLPGDHPLPKPSLIAPDGKVLQMGPKESRFPAEFDLVYPHPVTARGMFIRSGQWNSSDATLSYWDEKGQAFINVTRYGRSPTGPFSSKVGAAAFEPVTASKFRLTFHNAKEPSLISVELTGGSRISKWTNKAGYADAVHDSVFADTLGAGETEQKNGDAIPSDKIIDLSSKMDAQGVLTWTPPPGQWTVLRFGHTPTGIHVEPTPRGGKGLECDKLSVEAVNFHYDKCVTPVLERLGPKLVKDSLMYYHVDSYEASWQTWTRDFRKNFTNLRGYDLLKFLPCLTGRMVVDSNQSERFLWDYRRTISDLFAGAHYRQLAKRCAADGIRFSSEPYTGPFESLQVGNQIDHPMIEFWTYYTARNREKGIPFKSAIFAGHTNERPIIGAEAFTSENGWVEHPYNIKALGDLAYAEGVNRFVLHVSAHQPWTDEHLKPGMTCGGNGTHFDRGNTWWKNGAPEYIGGYLSRCQAVLQQGEPQADVLYLQSEDSPSTYGPFLPKLPNGYEYDACSAEILARLKVVQGRLVLPKGKSYRYLVLPPNKRLTLGPLKHLVALAEKGAQIIGPVPNVSPSLGDAGKTAEFSAASQALSKWVRAERTFEGILAKDALPPAFAYDQNETYILRAAHRKIADMEVFFVANASELGGNIDCRFRVSGKIPELWYPDTGRIEECAFYEDKDGVTRIPITFAPSGSLFVVFRNGKPGLHVNRMEASESSNSLVITKAVYQGVKNPGLDVTQPLRERLQGNRLTVENFNSLGGDPEPYVVKTLTVDFEYNGKADRIVIKDGATLVLPSEAGANPSQEILRNKDGVFFRAFQEGNYQFALSDGTSKTVAVPRKLPPTEIKGPWKLEFPKGWGAPEQAEFPNLVSWPEHADEGIKYFSGTATYTNSFMIDNPNTRLKLDLGRVEVIAKVTLNGQSLGVLWKPPFVYDLSGKVQAGENKLQVEITNLWPNRLIGDENYPDDSTPDGSWLKGGVPAIPEWIKKAEPRPEPRRLTFTTCKHWKKGDPLLPSGLLGPVMLHAYEDIPITGDQR
ncbi:MAG: glycosyl hydrolase [Luteolibacter sp.]